MISGYFTILLLVFSFFQFLYAEQPSTFQKAFIKKELVGFGSGTTGGSHGRIYTVNSLDDPESCPDTLGDAGSLRCAAEATEPLWVVFGVSGVIRLNRDIMVESHKTLDGRGAEVTLSDYSLQIGRAYDEGRTHREVYAVENVILTNLNFNTVDYIPRNVNWEGEDAITIRGAKKIWIYHCSFYDWGDGQIDINRQSKEITISYSLFSTKNNYREQRHMIFGKAEPSWASKLDTVMTGTIHHNYYHNVRRRTPRIGSGFLHFYNNYINGTRSEATYVIGKGRLLGEYNIYKNADRDKKGLRTFRCQKPDSPKVKTGIIQNIGNWYEPKFGHWFESALPVNQCNPSGVNLSSLVNYKYYLTKDYKSLKNALMKGAGAIPE